VLEVIRRLLVGRPLASAEIEEQRLSKTIALAVFSSDALSSTAYATEEILSSPRSVRRASRSA
jgi:hypothetical protein